MELGLKNANGRNAMDVLHVLQKHQHPIQHNLLSHLAPPHLLPKLIPVHQRRPRCCLQQPVLRPYQLKMITVAHGTYIIVVLMSGVTRKKRIAMLYVAGHG